MATTKNTPPFPTQNVHVKYTEIAEALTEEPRPARFAHQKSQRQNNYGFLLWGAL